MNLTSKKVLKNLLKKHQALPLKRFGQIFLIDKGVIKKIIRAADLKPSEIVLEIGPGIGNLTIELAKKVKKVMAVEKDPKMVEILKNVLNEQDIQNIQIIQADILKTNLKSEILNLKSYKVVANLPFYLTAPVIRKFLENTGVRPLQMILLVQKEVAQRICAKPPRMNLLAASTQFYAKPEIISFVSKKSFWPSPKVDGAILKITPASPQRPVFCQLFFRIVKAGFSQPRKQLVNNLSKGLKMEREKVKGWLLKNGVQPGQRAETLTVEDWLKLTKNFNITEAGPP